MLYQLALLLLEALAHGPTPGPAMAPVETLVWCDDGSAPWHADGQPNWACTLQGCTPQAAVCWEERLDHCYDDEGRDLGECAYEFQKCDSRYSCFNLWLYCDGVYHCNTNEVIGCSSGSCTAASTRPDGEELAGRD